LDKLKNKYKLAIIPKGTLLFRKAVDNKVYESMYFSFNYIGTYCDDNSATTQIWKTTKPIISRLIVKGMLSPHIYETDIAYCYEKFCGEDVYYLNAKRRNNPKLKQFLDYLKTNGITSWVTSAENHTPMELHLFTGNNKSLVKFKQTIEQEKNILLLKKDSFDKVVVLNPYDHI